MKKLISSNLDLVFNELNKNGAALLACPNSEKELISIASRFGKVLPDNNGKMVQVLKVRPKNTGITGSFSYVMGMGEFPWHTDTAFWDTPARYIILHSGDSSSCPTNFIKFDELLPNKKRFQFLSSRAIFTINIPSSIKAIPFIFRSNTLNGYRYDQHIMKPYNSEAYDLDSWIREQLEREKFNSIYWDGKFLALIDNWKVIHNRSACFDEPNRKLLRIYIG